MKSLSAAVAFAEEQVDPRRRAVASGAAGLLVELGQVEVEVVEKHVAHVG